MYKKEVENTMQSYCIDSAITTAGVMRKRASYPKFALTRKLRQPQGDARKQTAVIADKHECALTVAADGVHTLDLPATLLQLVHDPAERHACISAREHVLGHEQTPEKNSPRTQTQRR